MNLHSDTVTDTKKEDCLTLPSQAVEKLYEALDVIGPLLAMGIVECADVADSVHIRVDGKVVASVKKQGWYDGIRRHVECVLEN